MSPCGMPTGGTLDGRPKSAVGWGLRSPHNPGWGSRSLQTQHGVGVLRCGGTGLGQRAQHKKIKNKKGNISLPFLSPSVTFFSPSSDASFPSRAKVQKKKAIYFGLPPACQLGLGFWGLFSLFYSALFFQSLFGTACLLPGWHAAKGQRNILGDAGSSVSAWQRQPQLKFRGVAEGQEF